MFNPGETINPHEAPDPQGGVLRDRCVTAPVPPSTVHAAVPVCAAPTPWPAVTVPLETNEPHRGTCPPAVPKDPVLCWQLLQPREAVAEVHGVSHSAWSCGCVCAHVCLCRWCLQELFTGSFS